LPPRAVLDGPIAPAPCREANALSTTDAARAGVFGPTPWDEAGIVPLDAAKGDLLVLDGLVPHMSYTDRSPPRATPTRSTSCRAPSTTPTATGSSARRQPAGSADRVPPRLSVVRARSKPQVPGNSSLSQSFIRDQTS
jgi:hypothetical protein